MKFCILQSLVEKTYKVWIANRTLAPELTGLNVDERRLRGQARYLYLICSLLPHWPSSFQPAYIHYLLKYHIPGCSLCSSNTSLLLVSRVRTTCAFCGFVAVHYSRQAFALVRHHTHSARRLLKTHCFEQAFSSPERFTCTSASDSTSYFLT